MVRDLAGSGAVLDAGLLAGAGQKRNNGNKFEKHGSHRRLTFLSFQFGFRDPLVQKKDKAVEWG